MFNIEEEHKQTKAKREFLKMHDFKRTADAIFWGYLSLVTAHFLGYLFSKQWPSGGCTSGNSIKLG
jgi:hypothetical protein